MLTDLVSQESRGAFRWVQPVVSAGGVLGGMDHQMSAVDASDGALADTVFRGLNAALRSPRAGRQLRGFFLRAGLVDVEAELVSLPITSWPDLRSLFMHDDLVAMAVAARLASREAAQGLVADLEARDAEGRFFACLVAVRCRGVRPATLDGRSGRR